MYIEGGSLADAVNAGVAKGYTEGYQRKLVVDDPLFIRIGGGIGLVPVML